MRAGVPRRRRWLAGLLAALALGASFGARGVCREADRTFDGDGPAVTALAGEVAHAALMRTGRPAASRASGQAAVALAQMTILGLGQILREHPERRAAYLPAIRAAGARLIDPRALGYASKVWGENGLVSMKPGDGHADGHAYLGYINLALGMWRAVDPEMWETALHDRLTAALAERLDQSPTGLIETYPGETWPPDVAAVAGSIGLHPADHRALLARWAERFARCAVSPSGYLVQRVASGGCRPLDAPRGSGTAIAAYFIGFAAPPLAHRLYAALRTRGRVSHLGLAGVREYLDGRDGPGDLNSGPIVLGASVGATGYALGAARAQGDRAFFDELWRGVALVRETPGALGLTKLPGGPTLANALLLAMLTANPLEAPSPTAR